MLKGSQDTFEGDERGTSLNVAMMTRVALMAAVTAAISAVRVIIATFKCILLVRV